LVGGFDYWRHNDPHLSRGIRKNADSRLHSMFLGNTVSLPIENGELVLGNWRAVILVELDSLRSRSVQIQLLGLQWQDRRRREQVSAACCSFPLL
jgi:thiamine phosphate synthase YjbQ (UPF0047 family)